MLYSNVSRYKNDLSRQTIHFARPHHIYWNKIFLWNQDFKFPHPRCLMNCGSQLNPSARLVLSGKCTDCTATTQPSFEWTLLPGNTSNARQTLDWSKDTTTGRYYPYLAIQAGVFAGSHDETYILRQQSKGIICMFDSKTHRVTFYKNLQKKNHWAIHLVGL